MTFDLQVNGEDIAPGGKWKAIRHPAFYLPEGEEPNYRLPESNIGFDAGRDTGFAMPGFDDTAWPEAREVSPEEAGWGRLVERPIPQWKDFGLKPYGRIEARGDTMLVAYLPYNAQVTPFVRLKAGRGQRVRILTDNYRGGSATNVFAEYTTTDGVQQFECPGWMNGHYVVYRYPKGVEILEVKYRETGYATTFAGSFSCDDPALNRLWEKSQRTLYFTMRDTYMDCPDRERAQWWGDVVNESGEAFYALDERAHRLTRKGIRELMDWQRADSTIFSPVPAGNYDSELPMQMLASVGYYGFWNYYMGTGDSATMAYVYPKVKKYIHVWKTDPQGLVVPRKGGWTWGDWGDNKDMELLFNQWYIIALQGYGQMARLVGDGPEAQWAAATAQRTREAFHKKYWNGSYYVSPGYKGQPDDRAQALAVVSGTLPEELYPTLRPFFRQQYHASPYMERKSRCVAFFQKPRCSSSWANPPGCARPDETALRGDDRQPADHAVGRLGHRGRRLRRRLVQPRLERRAAHHHEPVHCRHRDYPAGLRCLRRQAAPGPPEPHPHRSAPERRAGDTLRAGTRCRAVLHPARSAGGERSPLLRSRAVFADMDKRGRTAPRSGRDGSPCGEMGDYPAIAPQTSMN